MKKCKQNRKKERQVKDILHLVHCVVFSKPKTKTLSIAFSLANGSFFFRAFIRTIFRFL